VDNVCVGECVDLGISAAENAALGGAVICGKLCGLYRKKRKIRNRRKSSLRRIVAAAKPFAACRE